LGNKVIDHSEKGIKAGSPKVIDAKRIVITGNHQLLLKKPEIKLIEAAKKKFGTKCLNKNIGGFGDTEKGTLYAIFW
jgi:hypothetical protein